MHYKQNPDKEDGEVITRIGRAKERMMICLGIWLLHTLVRGNWKWNIALLLITEVFCICAVHFLRGCCNPYLGNLYNHMGSWVGSQWLHFTDKEIKAQNNWVSQSHTHQRGRWESSPMSILSQLRILPTRIYRSSDPPSLVINLCSTSYCSLCLP